MKLNDIVLSKSEWKTLKKMSPNTPVNLGDIGESLRVKELVARYYKAGERDWTWSGLSVLTASGIDYITWRKASEKKVFWSEARAWITLAIAVAAFVKSFFH